MDVRRVQSRGEPEPSPIPISNIIYWTQSNSAHWPSGPDSETPRKWSFARKEDHDDAHSGYDCHRDKIEDRPALLVVLGDLLGMRVR